MFSNKDIIKLKPIRRKDILSLKSKNDLKFTRSDLGFYTNNFLVLKTVHSTDISKIEIIDINSTEKVSSTNVQKINQKSIKYEFEWFNFEQVNSLLKIKYANGTIKYFYPKKDENDVVWNELNSVTHIVYLDENLNNLKSFMNMTKTKYSNLKEQIVLIKSFDDALNALSYILTNDVNIVILTTEYMKNLSAKNLIKRVKKTKDNVKFIFFNNNKDIIIEDVEIVDNSNISLLFKKLNSIIKPKR